MVKNVVFDLGGVLVDLNPAKVIKQYFSKEDADFILSNIFFSKEWREVDRGVLTPDEAFHKYKDDIAPGAYEKLMDIIENWNEHMPPFDDVYALVKRVKSSGAKVYLLSNIPPYIHKMFGCVPALSLLDGFVASCDIKLLKPEREIYEHLLQKYNLKAEESIFIDDTLENVEGARAVGMKAHHFANHDLAALEAALRECGVNI